MSVFGFGLLNIQSTYTALESFPLEQLEKKILHVKLKTTKRKDISYGL